MMKIIVGDRKVPKRRAGTREEAGAWEPEETFDAGSID